jgi:thiol-disulfide isomerase/thioredoxin
MTFPRLALALSLFLPFASPAQQTPPAQPSTAAAPLPPAQGINFEHGLPWSAIQAKAKAENKYILVDCFTTWCGPCRFMTTQIFPQKESGDYFNDKFVSVAVQLDTTAKDAPEVKAWYADGHAIAQQYHVNAYPTYLVFAPDGHVVHRMLGSTRTAADFIKETADAFDSTKQYYTQVAQYDHGRRDSAFLRRLSWQCIDLYDPQKAEAVVRDYLMTVKDLYNKGALDLLLQTTSKSTDKYFAVFTDHAAEVDQILGAGAANKFVREVYLREGTGQAAGDTHEPNWAAIHKKIAAKLPEQADELTTRIKVNYYRKNKDWTHFEPAIVAYMKDYGAKMTDQDLNTIAWTVFSTCPDMSCVAQVLDWSKRLKETGNPAFLDTYANILYKTGHKDDAIALEQKAIDLSAPADKADLQATLDKMQKNEKTWN